MVSEAALRGCLAECWGLPEATIEAHHGGMNSATWFVSHGGARWVAKAVHPAARRSFEGGVAVAATLEAATGIPAGAAVPTRDGALVTSVEGVPLALLSWVPGEALSGQTPGEQRLIGATLARVHRALRDSPIGDAGQFHWIDPRTERLSIRPWVRPAVAEAVAALERLGPETLTQGLLHGDPAPAAFRLDRATGACGLIDWGGKTVGPLLYDLASAVMYAGGPDRADPLVESYLEYDVMPPAEVERALLVMLRFRFAVQADYFAHRIATADLTGITSADGNEIGLEHARRGLSDPRLKAASGSRTTRR